MQTSAMPNNEINFTLWRLCAWAGPVYIIGTAVSWALIAGFLPPPAEYLGAQEMYQFYLENNLMIRIGMVLTLAFAPLFFVWSAVAARVVAQSEGPHGVMSIVQLLGGLGSVIVTWAACSGWLSAAFDTALKSPQDIKTVSDWSWMFFNAAGAMPALLQFFSFGLGCLFDKRKIPLIPNWVCWFSFAMGTMMLLAELTPFFRTGPFAWHGLLCYYVGLGMFFLWILVACVFVLKAIARLERESKVELSHSSHAA